MERSADELTSPPLAIGGAATQGLPSAHCAGCDAVAGIHMHPRQPEYRYASRFYKHIWAQLPLLITQNCYLF